MRVQIEHIIVGLLAIGCFGFGAWTHSARWADSRNPLTISLEAPATISARRLSGEARAIDSEGLKRPTLLLVLSADCRYCEQNAPQWRGLVTSLGTADSSPAVIALSLSDAEDTVGYMADNDLDVPALLIDHAGLAALGLPSVPGTVALDAGSATMRTWIGALSESEVAAILTLAMAN
jgi:hypothetical protein